MSDQTTDAGVVLYEQPVRFLPTRDESGRIWSLAQQIAETEFVPSNLRGNPHGILAAMLTGREIGIGAMHALRAIDVIDGRPSLSPELMASLVLRHPAGHELYPEESTAARCVMAGRRGDWPTDRIIRVEWTLGDARLAGLVGTSCDPAAGQHDEREVKKNGRNGPYTKVECGCRQGWKTYPRAMLRARATAELVRSIFPDVVERIGYTVEELGGEPVAHVDAMPAVEDVAPAEVVEVVDATFADDEPAVTVEPAKAAGTYAPEHAAVLERLEILLGRAGKLVDYSTVRRFARQSLEDAIRAEENLARRLDAADQDGAGAAQVAQGASKASTGVSGTPEAPTLAERALAKAQEAAAQPEVGK
jgi:hypothetical protein